MENRNENVKNNGEGASNTYICIGLTAHVDAGKTTLAEALLYETGAIRRKGRVDHGDTFLDIDEMERKRGITIFSRQAICHIGGMQVTLLDTPGHIDFSGEMERSLLAMDAVILVVSGAQDVDPHTIELWGLLRRRNIPVLLFVNKMDMPQADRRWILGQLRKKLSERCVDWEKMLTDPDMAQEAALLDESLFEEYIQEGRLSAESVRGASLRRRLFPCFFGSALLGDGVASLVTGIADLFGESAKERSAQCPGDSTDKTSAEDAPFSALAVKIARDEKGHRQTVLKIRQGQLAVRQMLSGEKVSEIRLYSGAGYTQLERAFAGQLVHVYGLAETQAGDRIGAKDGDSLPKIGRLSEPVMTYELLCPDGEDQAVLFRCMQELAEEDPMLRTEFHQDTGHTAVCLTGDVQMEVLREQIHRRFGIRVEFTKGQVSFRETIRGKVEGIGHFEPLRHYAEVHILIEEGEPGSGISVSSRLSEEQLALVWQKQALKYMAQVGHRGVLTGSLLTDVKLTLIAGRGHQKHTEGGDFKEAVCRAVRQGLRKADSVLLEPMYRFTLSAPASYGGRIMADLQKIQAEFEPPVTEEGNITLQGTVTVRRMHGYFDEFRLLTKGKGQIGLQSAGYAPCEMMPDAKELPGPGTYDPDQDKAFPCGSVFCAKGAGFYVPWQEVDDYAHIPPLYRTDEGGAGGTADFEKEKDEKQRFDPDTYVYDPNFSYAGHPAGGQKPRRRPGSSRPAKAKTGILGSGAGKTRAGISDAAGRRSDGRRQEKTKIPSDGYLLVDGYNIIYAWEELALLAGQDMGAARERLADMLADYQAFTGCTLILVFDAYKVEEGTGGAEKRGNVFIVFTKEAETADQYIEKTVHHLSGQASVTVATSDRTEQVIIMGKGAFRLSAGDLHEELVRIRGLIRERVGEHRRSQEADGRNYLLGHAKAELSKQLEDVRLGKETGLYKK